MVPCSICLDQNGYEYNNLSVNKSASLLPMAYFHVPGPENMAIFTTLIKMQEKYPHAFYENRKIVEVYGSFCGATWNGRTPNFKDKIYSVEQLDQIREEIEELGIKLNLTWNNTAIKDTDVYDRLCNAITKVFHNGRHAITVASPILFNYLKEKYPNYTYYQSVIAVEKDAHFNKKDERYDMFLINRHLNNNWEELLKIPLQERYRYEFLCNDACTPICDRSIHQTIGNASLIDRKMNQVGMEYLCTLDHDFLIYNADKWPITIKSEDIDTYLDNGYQHFKLCSRGDPVFTLAFKTIRYLVKPEYWGDAISWCATHQTWTETEHRAKPKQ